MPVSADDITKVCLDLYNSLKKTGKPSATEWTVLAAIAIEFDNKLEVVALGTGTKCIGKFQMLSEGTVLNDSHAEVICRRAFIRYLYNEMLREQSDILMKTGDELFQFVEGVKFHMYSSLMPCGDASIFPKNDIENNESNYGIILNDGLHLGSVLYSDDGTNTAKRIKLDYNCTGAKCLSNDDKVDLKEYGRKYHKLGAVRTKPGRGEPTLSVSCSDKLAKWVHLGLQGSLMSLILDKPVYLSSITIGHESYCKEALERALFKRFADDSVCNNEDVYKLHIPDVSQSTIVKFHAQKCDSKSPAPGSIIYIKNGKTEVAIEGFKQGATKKNRFKPRGRLQVCKLELFACFLKVAQKTKLNINSKSSYGALKESSNYAQSWRALKRNMFKVWPEKNPMLEEFFCNEQLMNNFYI